MGVRILTDNGESAVLYCSTSQWAFGPVFSDDKEHDALERAEAFLRWLDAPGADGHLNIRRFEQQPLSSGRDVRSLTDRGLENAYANWLAQEAEQWTAEEAAEEDEAS